jgi:hypothetical protein
LKGIIMNLTEQELTDVQCLINGLSEEEWQQQDNWIFALNDKGCNRWCAVVQPCGPGSAQEDERFAIASLMTVSRSLIPPPYQSLSRAESGDRTTEEYSDTSRKRL